MLLHIHPDNPQPRLIKQVAGCLRDGGIIIYPTDTVYGLGCDIMQPKAMKGFAALRKWIQKKYSFLLCAAICRT